MTWFFVLYHDIFYLGQVKSSLNKYIMAIYLFLDKYLNLLFSHPCICWQMIEFNYLASHILVLIESISGYFKVITTYFIVVKCDLT